MSEEELRDRIQIAISKPENQYKTPYARTSDGKDSLHIWMINTSKSADSVIQLLKELKIINYESEM
jgi:hypothetical protein